MMFKSTIISFSLTRLLSSFYQQHRSITLSERESDVILLQAAVSTDTDQRTQPIDLTSLSFTLHFSPSLQTP